MTRTRQDSDRAAETAAETPDSLANLTRSVGAFGRTIDHLQTEYAALEARHAELNSQLTEINQALQTSLEANRRLAAYLDRILAEIPTGIIAVDAEGIVRLFNPAASVLLNLAADGVMHRPYYDVWPDRRADTATAAACATGHPPATDQRREVPRANAPPLVLSVSTVPLSTNGRGEGRTGALEVFTNLTEFESLHEQMTRMRTLAALGEMAATVAHEIRNPLGGMLGFAELLARHSQEDPVQRDMSAKILTGAQHMNRLVQRLLDFARDPKVELRPLEWPRFLQITLDQYEENARHRGVRLSLARKWPEKLPSACADALCLRQAIWNVLENAEQAGEPGSPIDINAEPDAAGGVRLIIADRGPGLDPGIAGRVFAPFFTTREKGTGLGLATARKIVEAHGGKISIGNREGGGAEVRMELPPPGRTNSGRCFGAK